MKNGVLRIFPPLLLKASFRMSGIFDETVAVRIAEPVDPFEGGFDIWPDAFYESGISGSLVIGRGEQNEQWSRIHAAVVMAKWYLAKLRHFSLSHLMKDLAWFGIAIGIKTFRLCRRKIREYALSH